MSYEINDNRYITLRTCRARELFQRQDYVIDRGTEISSVWASWIYVADEEQILFQGLTPQEGIDKRIELGYIALVV